MSIVYPTPEERRADRVEVVEVTALETVLTGSLKT